MLPTLLQKTGEKYIMNTVCMKDGSCPEIKMLIPSENYNSPQHLEEQIQSAIEDKFEVIILQIHSMVSLSCKKLGNRVSLHVEIQIEPK